VATLDEALDALLGPNRTGDLDQDLDAAGQEAWERRIRNTEYGAAVIDAMRDRGRSYRDIEERTSIPKSNAQRWATPPSEATA
jgi:hypothetical protein